MIDLLDEEYDIHDIKKGDILTLSVRVNNVSSTGTLNCGGNINITQHTANVIVDVDDSLKLDDLKPGVKLTNLPGHRLVYIGPSREEGFVVCEDLDIDEAMDDPYGEYLFTALSLDTRPEPAVYDNILYLDVGPAGTFLTPEVLFNELFGYIPREQKIAEAA